MRTLFYIFVCGILCPSFAAIGCAKMNNLDNRIGIALAQKTDEKFNEIEHLISKAIKIEYRDLHDSQKVNMALGITGNREADILVLNKLLIDFSKSGMSCELFTNVRRNMIAIKFDVDSKVDCRLEIVWDYADSSKLPKLGFNYITDQR